MHAELSSLMNFEPGLDGFEAILPDDNEPSSMLSSAMGGLGAVPPQVGVGVGTPYADRLADQRTVMAGALLAGTPAAGAVARKLLARSVQLGEKADRRAAFTQSAQNKARMFLRQAENLDRKVAVIASRVLNADGSVKAGADPNLVQQLAVMRKLAVDSGRRSIRFTKAAAVGKGLAHNSMAQAELLQQMSGAVLAGRPDLVAPLMDVFAVLGEVNRAAKTVRQAQLARQAQGLEGLSLDVIESELDGLEAEENARFAAFGGLEGCCRRLKRRARQAVGGIKKAAKATVSAVKTVAKPVYKKVLKPVGKVVKKAAQKTLEISSKVLLKWPCKVMSSAVGKYASQAAGTIVGTFYGGPVGGAVGMRAGERAHEVDKAMCKAIDKIGLTKGTFRPGKVKGAFKEAAVKIGKNALDPKEALKTAMAVGTAYVGGGVLSKVGGEKISALGLNKLGAAFQGKAASYAQSLASKEAAEQLTKLGGKAVKSLSKEAKKKALDEGKKLIQKLPRDEVVKLARKQATKLFTGNVAKLVGKEAAMELRKTSARELIADLA